MAEPAGPEPDGEGAPLDPVSGAPLAFPGLGSWKRIAIAWGSGFLVIAVVVTFFLHFADVELFVETMRSANPTWLAAAALCQIATYVAAALVWHGVLVNAGARQKFMSLFNLAILELFANQALPTGGISGSILVVHGLVRRGVDGAVATTALLVAYISYYAAYLLVGSLAFILLWQLGDLRGAWLTLLISFLVLIALVALLLIAIAWAPQRLLPAPVRAWAPLSRLIEILKRVGTRIITDPAILAQATAYQVAIFLLDAATLWCAGKAVGAQMEAGSAYISFMLASMISTVTPIPMGLGTFEGASAGMLHFLGSSVEASLAATLILRGLTLWLPMVPGLWLMHREGRRR